METPELPVGLRDLHDYGMTPDQLFVELFRLNGGKAGYYIADLKHKLYYYCGLELTDLKRQFRKLGIGRVDPVDR